LPYQLSVSSNRRETAEVLCSETIARRADSPPETLAASKQVWGETKNPESLARGPNPALPGETPCDDRSAEHRLVAEGAG
jgi:hypothetical protein